MGIPITVVLIILIALAFEFINGFHDTANAVATSISTKSLEPFQAIGVASVFNLIGAFSGTAVAMTIAQGFTSPGMANNTIILSALLAAIMWNLFTWYFGIPSTSSHALIGGLVGAIIASYGFSAVHYNMVLYKVILPMLISPVLGFTFAALIVSMLYKLLRNNTEPRRTNNFIREIQVVSTAFLSFSHGANDSQKTMGIITLVLFEQHLLTKCQVPIWVIVICAICMALGTLSGGIRIIKTLSTRVAKLKPASGFAAEISSAVLLFAASRFGIPLSTTQAVSGSIMGAGSASGKFGINWSVVKRIIIAWVLTFPISALLASGFIALINLYPGQF